MARVCMVTGKGTSSGNNRSHSNRATKRTYAKNLIKKKIKIDGEEFVVRVSARMYKKMRGFV